MYLERLQKLGFNDVLDMYPDFKRHLPVLINKNYLDLNILFHTVQRDYSYLFEIILREKFSDYPFKFSNFKENNFKYNECCYVLDCNEWNIQHLREFLMEYCKLNNIMLRTNLFVIYNFDKVDLNTQHLIGTLIEKHYLKCRFWLVVSSLGKMIYKIHSRVLIATIKRPNRELLKQYLMKCLEKPTFEILIDKILEKSNDYGSALIYLDMLTIDPSILNRKSFTDEINELDRFIYDKNHRETNFPKLREICYKLLEKMNFIEIIYLFIKHFTKTISNKNYISLIVTKACELEHINLIPNKQVWLLENWFIYCIFVINNIEIGFNPITEIKNSNPCNKITNVPLII